MFSWGYCTTYSAVHCLADVVLLAFWSGWFYRLDECAAVVRGTQRLLTVLMVVPVGIVQGLLMILAIVMVAPWPSIAVVTVARVLFGLSLQLNQVVTSVACCKEKHRLVN